MAVLRSASGPTCRLGCDSAGDVSEDAGRVSITGHLMAKRTPTTKHRLIRCAPSAAAPGVVVLVTPQTPRPGKGRGDGGS